MPLFKRSEAPLWPCLSFTWSLLWLRSYGFQLNFHLCKTIKLIFLVSFLKNYKSIPAKCNNFFCMHAGDIRLYGVLNFHTILSSCISIIMCQKSAQIRILHFFFILYAHVVFSLHVNPRNAWTIVPLDHGTSKRWYCKTPCAQMYPPSWNPSMSENSTIRVVEAIVGYH